MADVLPDDAPDFFKLVGDNKEFALVPGADHCDLYDQTDKIPFDRIGEFFTKNLQRP